VAHTVRKMLLLSAASIALSMPGLVQAQTADAAAPPATASESDDGDIIVTGIRGSAYKAQTIKRDAASVVESVTLEDLGKFSDTNIADVLQRVPGVQIERNDSGVAGDRASIRGLGPSYVQVTVNGRVPLTGGNEGVVSLRQINLDVLPTEIVSGLLVYKTPTADLVESGLAGTVELQTLKALDYKSPLGHDLFGSITVRGDDDDQTSRFSPRISGVVGGKFFDDTLGVYIAGLWSSTDVRRNELFSRFSTRDLSFDDNSDGVVDRTIRNVLVPSQITTSQNRGTEDRLAFSGGVQWRPSDRFELNAELAYSKFNNEQNRPYGDLLDGSNAIYAGVARPGGYVVENGRLLAFDTSRLTYAGARPTVGYDAYPLRFDNNQTSWVGGVNAKWKGDRWGLKLDYGYTKANFLQELRTFVGGTPAANANLSYDGRPEVPVITGITNVTHPAGSTQFVFFAREYVNNSDAHQFRADFDYDASDSVKFRVGARYQRSDINVSSAVIVSVAPDAATGFTSTALTAVSSALFRPGSTGFLSRYNFGIAQPDQDYNAGANLVPQLRDAVYGANDPVFGFRAQEDIFALYGQGDVKGTFLSIPFDGNFGIRAVHTGLKSQAATTSRFVTSRLIEDPTLPSTTAQISDRNDYWTFLPSSNLTFKPSDNFNVRLSISRVMSRAEYEDTAPRNALTFLSPNDPANDLTQNSTGSAGNTRLKPLTAWQYDIGFEYYTPNRGALYASFFYKDVRDFVSRIVDRGVTLPGQGARLFNVTRPVNVSNGRVYGFELGFDEPLTFLPGAFNGLGIQGNYTYIDSKLNSSGNPDLDYGFPGASKHNFNGVLYYEKAGFGARLAYSYRSNYFQALGGGNDRSAQPTFTKGYGQLNASVSYKIFQNLEASITAVNLTRADRRDYIVDQQAFRSFIQRSRVFSFALRASY
jgi:iron complex outermembrane recepter protein